MIGRPGRIPLGGSILAQIVRLEVRVARMGAVSWPPAGRSTSRQTQSSFSGRGTWGARGGSRLAPGPAVVYTPTVLAT